ncbi:MAG: Hsp20/alpha crystallin family protein [Candidatus Methylomirabilales bacterium]
MVRLTRWTRPRGIARLREEMDGLFDRFFGREEEWIPGRMMRSLREFHRDLDALFGDFLGADRWRESPFAPVRSWPRCESLVEGGDYVLRAEIPGVAPDDLEVAVTENALTIRGDRKTGREEQGGASYSRFSRRFSLPEPVDPEKVKAKLAHGVLEVRIPASPKVVGKRIPVEVETGEVTRQIKAA